MINYGVGGTTALNVSDYPYTTCTSYQKLMSSKPDYVVLMLGTNDSKVHNWNEDNYAVDLEQMIRSIMKLNVDPGKIHVMIPPPLYKDGAIEMQQKVFNDVFPQLIPKIVEKIGSGLK